LRIVVALLGCHDDGRRTGRKESVMRHFLALACLPRALPGGVPEPAPKRLLVPVASPLHASASRHARTFTRAVTLAMIATAADPQLLVTAGTIEQAVIGCDPDHEHSGRHNTRQRVVITSLSLQRDRRPAAIIRRSLR